MDGRTDEQPRRNMPPNFFEVGGINREKNCRENRIFSSLNGNDNINLHFCLETYESKNLFVLRFYGPVMWGHVQRGQFT